MKKKDKKKEKKKKDKAERNQRCGAGDMTEISNHDTPRRDIGSGAKTVSCEKRKSASGFCEVALVLKRDITDSPIRLTIYLSIDIGSQYIAPCCSSALDRFSACTLFFFPSKNKTFFILHATGK